MHAMLRIVITKIKHCNDSTKGRACSAVTGVAVAECRGEYRCGDRDPFPSHTRQLLHLSMPGWALGDCQLPGWRGLHSGIIIIIPSSHSIIAMGPAPLRSGNKREHCSRMLSEIKFIAHIPSLNRSTVLRYLRLRYPANLPLVQQPLFTLEVTMLSSPSWARASP
jgi:hypothetical protein